MKYLIVVAHPDDEVLGAGASIWKWAHNGDQVDGCVYHVHGGQGACVPSGGQGTG